VDNDSFVKDGRAGREFQLGPFGPNAIAGKKANKNNRICHRHRAVRDSIPETILAELDAPD
jgi:hypothetical protein